MGNALLSCCPPNTTYPLARYQLVAARQNEQSTERVQLEIRTVQSGWRAAQERCPAPSSFNVDTILYSSDENLIGILNDSSDDDFEVNELRVRQVSSDVDDYGGSDFEELCFKVRQHALTRDYSSSLDGHPNREGQPDVIQAVSRSFEGRPRSFETFGSIISETYQHINWETSHSDKPKTPNHSPSLRAAVVGNPHLGENVVISRPRTTSLGPVHSLNLGLEKFEASLCQRKESFIPVHRLNSNLQKDEARPRSRTESVCHVPVSNNERVDHSPRALVIGSKSNVDNADGNTLSTCRRNSQVPEVYFKPVENDDDVLESDRSLETIVIEEYQSDAERANRSMESAYDSGEEMLRSESEDSNSIYHEAQVEIQNIDIRTALGDHSQTETISTVEQKHQQSVKPLTCKKESTETSNNKSPITDEFPLRNDKNSNKPECNSRMNGLFSIQQILAKFTEVTEGKEDGLESSVTTSSRSQHPSLALSVEGVVPSPVSPPVPVHSPSTKACPPPSCMTTPSTDNTPTKQRRTVQAKKQQLVRGSTVDYPSLSHENQFMHLMVNPLAESDYSTSYQSTAVREPVDMSMASLNAESPPTASIDLEWDREPELGGFRRSRDLLDAEHSMANTVDSSAGGGSHLRSSCSTPNSLEWDFKESTMDLQNRIPEEDEEDPEDVWAASETEELLMEIEQLAARALRDEDDDRGRREGR